MRTKLISALIGVLAVALAGCMTGSSSAAPTHNDADVKFSQEMIPHHQQTIQLADLASKRATAESVKVVAAGVLSAEQAEINLMSGWLMSFGAPMPSAGHTGHVMPGMLTGADLAELEAAKGAAFDKQWLTVTAGHLRNGVQMAKTVLASGVHPDTKALAQKIVTTQEKEISEIDDLLAKP